MNQNNRAINHGDGKWGNGIENAKGVEICWECPGHCGKKYHRVHWGYFKNVGTEKKPTMVGYHPVNGSGHYAGVCQGGSSLAMDVLHEKKCSCHPFLEDGEFVYSDGRIYPGLRLLTFEEYLWRIENERD